MDNELPGAELVQRLRADDPQAARLLFERYARRLSHLAERHLSRNLAGKVGGDDVVQSVFNTFFQRCARGEFQIDNSGQLWRLLVKITVRKTRGEYRRYAAARRDAAIEAAEGEVWLAETVAREPGPEEAAVLVDEIEALLHGLPALYCHVLESRLQGHAVAEIAQQKQVSRQTVYQVLHILQRRLLQRSESDLA